MAVHRGRGDGQFLPFENYPPGSVNGTRWVQAGDFNGDGKPDVVAIITGGQFSGPGAVMVYLNKTP